MGILTRALARSARAPFEGVEMAQERIEKDTVIRTKYHSGKSRTAYLGKVTEVVVHGTAGGGTLNWMRSGGRAEQYYQAVALFHYLIDRSGKIIEVIDPDKWVYHSCRGSKDKNSVGIELENLSRDNTGDYTNAQYESLAWLIFDYLMNRYPDINVIMSHKRAWQKDSNGTKWKECPGPAFDWTRLANEMQERNIAFQHLQGVESFWSLKRNA